LGLARQVSAILAEAYQGARELIRRHAMAVEGIADLLLQKETVEGKEIDTVLKEAGVGLKDLLTTATAVRKA
jgi:ATP-dependent Zn protease